MALQNILVDFNDDGSATFRLPEGKRISVDQAKLAAFIEKLTTATGNIIEKHAAHTHVRITADGKVVAEEHVHE
jgi:hypothetical protein